MHWDLGVTDEYLVGAICFLIVIVMIILIVSVIRNNIMHKRKNILFKSDGFGRYEYYPNGFDKKPVDIDYTLNNALWSVFRGEKVHIQLCNRDMAHFRVYYRKHGYVDVDDYILTEHRTVFVCGTVVRRLKLKNSITFWRSIKTD